jgi:hypothetical protein
MPKLVGHGPVDGDKPLSEAPENDVIVRLTWPQAVRVRHAGAQIYYDLNASDRGGPGRLAKRWYEWYATVQDVLRSHPTESMYHRAAFATCHELGLQTRDVAEAEERARQAEEDRLVEVARKCEQLQAHARPECVRVVPGRPYASLRNWRRHGVSFFAVELLHDCGGSFRDELPSDLEAAAELIRSIQIGHDQVYHPEPGALPASELR